MKSALKPKKSTRPPLLPLARRIRDLSLQIWPGRPPVEFVGQSVALEQLLVKVAKFASYSEPILILGESGCGKELLARACYLLSDRVEHQFVPVSCPQYTDSGNTISELFGHRKGSFTGAVADRTGLFESANRGVIFLDEIADLPLQAQVMLLRTLAEGEFRRMGDSQTRTVNTRVIAATNRPLDELMVQKEFRHDLYFRLSYFPLQVPPLRDRQNDWHLIADRILDRLCHEHGESKRLAPETVEFLSAFHWPGNIRQLQAAVILGYSTSDGAHITLNDMEAAINCNWLAPSGPKETTQTVDQNRSKLGPSQTSILLDDDLPHRLFAEMVDRRVSFWKVIREPFLNRDLNRAQVRTVIDLGLQRCRGNYRKVVALFNLPATEYQKFMGFLRTHSLKFNDDENVLDDH